MESLENKLSLTTSFINVLDIMFKECPDGIVFKDYSLKYKAANKAFYKIFKLEEKNIIGEIENVFLSGENLKLIQQINQEMINRGEPISYIINYESKILSITSTPVIQNNVFLGIVSHIKDITDEETLKEKFVSKHSQIKSFLENIPMLIYMQDEHMNYIAGTKPSQSFFKEGYDAFSNIHINTSKIPFEDEMENHYVLEHKQILVKEKEVIDNKESHHWYKVYKVPIKDLNGDVSAVITLASNIDAEKQLNQQRETFVATLGHDLKNPTIAQIRGLELLLKGEFGDITFPQKELIEMVLDSCRYMNGMLASLLATYRDRGGAIKLNLEELSLPDLVMECVSEMVYVAKDKNVEISINSKLNPETITGDKVQLKRVIMNLISNGIKYAYKDSVLKLTTYKENSLAGFEFENHSPYIPEEKQKSIFAQYVSYASSHNELGIGLGLYASQKIIDAHNGKIYVESFKDNRNIFGFKIPANQAQCACNKEIKF